MTDFADKSLDSRLSTEPSPTEIALKEQMQGAATMGGPHATGLTGSLVWLRERSLELVIKAYGSSCSIGKIVCDADVVYNYLLSGKTPDKESDKDSKFLIKGAKR